VTAAVGRRYKWKVLGCVVFGIFMVILDTTVVNVAFPTLRSEFHASLQTSQWIVSVYVLSLGISTPLAGFLSDRFGIKRMYVGALGIFVMGSLLSGLAPSLGALIATRALQGVGGGIAVPLGTAMLFAVFPPNEQGTALGIYGISLLMAPALGPILGGLLVDHGRWRWIFFVNVPIGILGVILGSILLKEGGSRRHTTLDPWGLVTSVIGFGATLYAASMASQSGWTSPEVLLSFTVGLAALIAFVLIELRVAKDPLLDFRLYTNVIFLNASVVGYVSVIALFGAEFLLPIYLQVLRGNTAFHTGIILLPLAITAGITTPLAGRLYDRIGPRALVILGFAVLCVNTWQLSHLTATTTMRAIMILMAMRGFALGCTVQSTFTTALGTVNRQRVARGSSLVNSTRYVVQSIGVALLATVLASAQSPATVTLQRQAESANVAGKQHQEPERNQSGICSAQPAGAATSALQRACQENLTGFERAYRVTFFAAVLALLLGALLPGWPFQWKGRGNLGTAGAAA
jgi:EmrB/QacA subfamily drug resistance transporter